MTEKTVVRMFMDRVAASSSEIAFRYPAAGGWKDLTWSQTGERVRAIAMGLRSLGLQTGERAAIASGTRLEWVLADIGIMAAGGATTTVYPTSTVEDMVYILNDSRSRVVFAEDQSQVDRLLEARPQLSDVIRVITFDGVAREGGWFLTLGELEAMGSAYDGQNAGLYDRIGNELAPDALATLIYTSGTTGQPKGVELLHNGWVDMAEGAASTGLIRQDEHQFLWLPLSHSFGKAMLCIQIAAGFKTSIDGDLKKIIDNLAVTQPTFMASAPRIFEKVYNKIATGAEKAGGAKAKIFRWAVGVGRATSQAKQAGKTPGLALRVQFAICDKLVYSKIRARFGGNLRYFISGSAPLSRELAEFFDAAGLPILEGYGLTESSAASFVNRPDRNKIGTVGQPLPGVEVTIASDGEILIRGLPIMRGYHNQPDTTAEALDSDRWLHTGDIGELDSEGFLRITDRKKNLIKTSGGKYVAPQKVEGQLKVACPYLGQVLVHGDRRNYCTALVTLDPEAIAEWAGENGLGGASYEELTRNERVIAMVQTAVDQVNKELARYESLKYFRILPKDLTIEDDLITPSLKVKRKKVEERYRDLLDSMYEGAIAGL